MTNKTTTIVVDGNNITIDNALFQGYVTEAHGYLRRMDIEKENLKLLIETVSGTTALEKKHVSKYFKAHYAATTKEPKAQAELFESLDNVVGD